MTFALRGFVASRKFLRGSYHLMHLFSTVKHHCKSFHNLYFVILVDLGEEESKLIPSYSICYLFSFFLFYRAGDGA
jgi:hypothetical protein